MSSSLFANAIVKKTTRHETQLKTTICKLLAWHKSDKRTFYFLSKNIKLSSWNFQADALWQFFISMGILNYCLEYWFKVHTLVTRSDSHLVSIFLIKKQNACLATDKLLAHLALSWKLHKTMTTKRRYHLLWHRERFEEEKFNSIYEGKYSQTDVPQSF